MGSRWRGAEGARGALAGLAAGLGCLALPLAGTAQAPFPAAEGPEGIDVAPPAVYADAALRGRLAGEKLVVLDRAHDRALLVDPSTRAVLARVPTGLAPHELSVTGDGRHAYVANYGVDEGDPAGPGFGAASPPEGSVTVLDLQTGSVVRTLRPFRVAAGRVMDAPFRRMHGVQVAVDGGRLWLTAEADSGVVEMDARTGEVLMLWKTGAGMSHTLVGSSGGRKLFIANRWSDSVTVIDRLTVTAHRIPTGRRPEGLALSPSSRELWVGNRGDHTITVIDARAQRRVATFDAGGLDPVRLTFRPDGSEVWVANRESRELAVFDARSRELVDRLPLEVEPLALQFAPDGQRLYVTAPEAGRVLVVDARRRHLLDSFETGGSPDGLAWSRVAPATASSK